MLLLALIPSMASAITLDVGSCDDAALAAARDTAVAALPAARASAVVEGVLAACPQADADTRAALAAWAGTEPLDPLIPELSAKLCEKRPSLLSDSLDGSYVTRMETAWRTCQLSRDGLYKKRDLVRTGGPISAALASHLYERWTSRGEDEAVARELAEIISGIRPLDRGLYADVAHKAVGAALPQSGGPGAPAHAACLPLVVVDVGAFRLDGAGVVVGTPQQREALRALPGLEVGLEAWVAPDGCPDIPEVVIAADVRATYGDLLLAVETAQTLGRRSRLLLAEAPDISMSGKARKRSEGMLLKSWYVDVGTSPDAPASQRIAAPPVLAIDSGWIDVTAPDLDPPRTTCNGKKKALVCAEGEEVDPDSYAWTPMLRAAGGLRTTRGVGAIDSVVVRAASDVTVGVMVKGLDAFAWALRDDDGEWLAPPPVVLADPSRPELSIFDGTNFEPLEQVGPAGMVPVDGGAMPSFERPDLPVPGKAGAEDAGSGLPPGFESPDGAATPERPTEPSSDGPPPETDEMLDAVNDRAPK